MDKIIEMWETISSYLSEFWEKISPHAEKAWEAISPYVMAVWDKFLSLFCQFGFVCADGELNWMGGAVIAVAAVIAIALYYSLKTLILNR